MTLEMMNFFKDYIAELEEKIQQSTAPNSAETKAHKKTRDDMQGSWML